MPVRRVISGLFIDFIFLLTPLLYSERRSRSDYIPPDPRRRSGPGSPRCSAGDRGEAEGGDRRQGVIGVSERRRRFQRRQRRRHPRPQNGLAQPNRQVSLAFYFILLWLLCIRSSCFDRATES